MTSRILAGIAEQVQEFHRHRYDIVLVGGDDGIVVALGAAGVPPPEQIIPASAAELSEFLRSRPAPQAIRPPRRAGYRGRYSRPGMRSRPPVASVSTRHSAPVRCDASMSAGR